MKISKKTRVIITGAGSGLGRELALQLAQRGAKVWATDIQLAAAETTAKQCLSSGASAAKASRCDVRVPAEFETLAAEIKGEWNGVDLLINNAGVAVAGEFGEQSLADWKWIVDINLWGVIYGCHYFIPLMKAGGGGHILNIASAAGLFSPPNMASYNVTKAAVIALSETLQAEAPSSGVKVTVVCPTFFVSGLLGQARISTPELRSMAEEVFHKKSFSTAQSVAKSCLRAIERNELYVLPSWDARLLWSAKRLAPKSFSKIISGLLPKTGPTQTHD